MDKEQKDRKPRLIYPVIVEGKYDKIKLNSLFAGEIFSTDGFGLFNDRQKKQFFVKLSQKTPLIIFTDSDSGGAQIRRLFTDLIPKERQIHLYIPQVKGKEKRKERPSKQGFLGVEGTEAATLLKIFDAYTEKEGTEEGAEQNAAKTRPLIRLDLYEKGYDGGEGSKEKRKALCRRLDLPENLSTAALLDALNLLYSREELEKLL